MTEVNPNGHPRSSIQRMTERLLNGTMGSEEFEHFEQILLSDPTARLTYIEHINVHAQLSHLGGAVEAIGDEVFSVRERPAFGTGSILAAVLTCCMMLGGAIYFTISRNIPEHSDAILGHIVTDTTPQSDKTGDSTLVRQPLKTGELFNLPFGMTRFQLSNGVACTLHGPARIQFETPSKLLLESGTFVASVPPEAIGFRVETPHVEVIDLGTTFSLSVGTDSELRVFQGLVSARQKSGSNRGAAPLLVRTGEAIRFAPLALAETRVDANESDQILTGIKQLYGVDHVEGAMTLLPVPPDSVQNTKLTSDSTIFLFREQAFVELTQPLKVVPPESKTHSAPGDFNPLELPVGTRCSSFLLHSDFATRQEPLRGTIRFQRPILGLIFSSDGLQNSDSLFAHSGTAYPTEESTFKYNQSRGCVIPFGGKGELADEIFIHEDGRGLTVTLNSPNENIDQIRILLQSDNHN
ncbi:MAG TPA: FecR domain-containing protein [Planctomicrobium sp.]|nr:FecR domain-containing protein [Planctomicrobium sp.]